MAVVIGRFGLHFSCAGRLTPMDGIVGLGQAWPMKTSGSTAGGSAWDLVALSTARGQFPRHA